LAERTARHELRRICRASRSASSSHRSAGTTSLTRLHCRARTAPLGSAVSELHHHADAARVDQPRELSRPRGGSRNAPRTIRTSPAATRHGDRTRRPAPILRRAPIRRRRRSPAWADGGGRAGESTETQVDDRSPPTRRGVDVVDRHVAAQVDTPVQKVSPLPTESPSRRRRHHGCRASSDTVRRASQDPRRSSRRLGSTSPVRGAHALVQDLRLHVIVQRFRSVSWVVRWRRIAGVRTTETADPVPRATHWRGAAGSTRARRRRAACRAWRCVESRWICSVVVP
jgi:hypothetical protein